MGAHTGPDELTEMGHGPIDAEPDHELDDRPTNRTLIRTADGIGGFRKGRLDSTSSDASVRFIEAFVIPGR